MLVPTQIRTPRNNKNFVIDKLHGDKMHHIWAFPIVGVPEDMQNIFYERGKDHSYHDLLHAKMVVPGGFQPYGISGYTLEGGSQSKVYYSPSSFGPNCTTAGKSDHMCWCHILRPTHNILIWVDQYSWAGTGTGIWRRVDIKTDPMYRKYYTMAYISFSLQIPPDTYCRSSFKFIIGEDGSVWTDSNLWAHCAWGPKWGSSVNVQDTSCEDLFHGLVITMKQLIISRADDKPDDDVILLKYSDAAASALRESLFYHYALQGLLPNTYYSSAGTTSLKTLSTYDLEPPARTIFLLNEDSWLQRKEDTLLLGRSGSDENYFLNSLKQHAFIDAVNNMPRLNDNSISNIKEISSFIYSLVTHRKVEIPKSLSSAWLAYRYQYTTSKLDLQEAISFVNRHADLGSLDREITTYGLATDYFNGTQVQLRCQIKCKPREVSFIKGLLRTLDTLGLVPDFYVIWDSIPYSFIVDWFLPVGDILSVLDAERTYSEENYDYSLIGYSLKYLNFTDMGTYSVYARWVETHPPELNSLYWFEEPSASMQTVGFRAIDALALTFGRL